nr:uncharacterized protein LOC109779641 [Aegilops tauschii subsp. strangulata]
MPAGKLLGFLTSERSIEANLEKIMPIKHMRKPARLHDVQKFTSCLASVSRFLSRLGKRALPLYQLMKKMSPFEWNDQANKAFRDLKRMLSTAPVLAAPADKQPLLLYIAATSGPVSMVLVVERQEKVKIQSIQRLVYYLSEVLSSSKQNYPHYQKMCYSVYLTAKKLKHSKMHSGLGVGIVLPSPKGDRLRYALQIHFATSNNVAEYEALVHGLQLAKELSIRRILCYDDSDLVV